MGLHGVGIGFWHHQGGALAPGRADGAEQIGVLVTLVGGLARPCAFAGPLSDKAVLLAESGLVLEPDLDRLSGRNRAQMRRERSNEVFL
jgi:hypothetical protein